MSNALRLDKGGTSQALCWRYLQADHQASECFSEEGMAELLRSGVLSAESMIWREGLPQWVALKDSEIASVVSPTVLPSPAPPARKSSRPGMEPDEARRHVRNMLRAGVLSVIATAVAAALLKPSLWIDAVVTGALLFGVYRASRVCAIAVLVLYLIGAVMRLAGMSGPRVVGLAVVALFLYFYVMGIRGTFALHRWRTIG
jgi:hypothetical protein